MKEVTKDGTTRKPRSDKYLGAMVGAAIGDALGWPNEYNSKSIRQEAPKNKQMFQNGLGEIALVFESRRRNLPR